MNLSFFSLAIMITPLVHNAFQLNTITHGTCFYFKCLIGRELRSDHSKPGQSPSTKWSEVFLGVGYLRSKQTLHVHLSLVSRQGKKYSKGTPSAILSLGPNFHIWFNAQPHRGAKNFLLFLSVLEAPALSSGVHGLAHPWYTDTHASKLTIHAK